MEKKSYMNRIKASLLGMLAVATSGGLFVSCSDEPDTKDFYVFETTMMSEYLQTRPQYSMFAEVVRRAGLMDLLSSYGNYTCFAPNNDAMMEYLGRRGMSSVDELTKADCDTIARTHLMKTMYSTGDMNGRTLPGLNMNRRVIYVNHGQDEDGNPVVFLNKNSHIIFSLRDDSLENGIMQPVNRVMESSNSMLPDILKEDPSCSLFYQALKATGLADSLFVYKDMSYKPSSETYSYVTDGHSEVAYLPEERLIGFTILVEPDSIYREKYGITTLEQLYEEACRRYDPVYGETDQPWHAFSPEQLTDRRNPLNRFVAYHILDRNVYDKSYLTPWMPQLADGKRDFTIETTLINPDDWHTTLLPHTMVYAQRLTKTRYRGPGKYGEHYINRRCDADYAIPGAMVSTPTLTDEALNGVYFYLDDIIAFDKQTSEVVQNVRIRMDMATLFPELITNHIRLNGINNKGKNYYIPDGYLDGVTVNGDFTYNSPHEGFNTYLGDEMNMLGEYDITFRLPPMPSHTSETYQIRLGFYTSSTRGICQIYFDGKPQGIPLDMTRSRSQVYPGLRGITYSALSADEQTELRKGLKNQGYYLGPRSVVNGHGPYCDVEAVYRMVICTVSIDPNKDHYLRFRNVSNNGSSELMLDWMEFVPKSVYGVNEDEGTPEDDL